MNVRTLFYKELIKQKFYSVLQKRMNRFHTPMHQVFMQLSDKGFVTYGGGSALEMFGMFGLWHTKDYVDLVGHIDFFEIDPNFIKYAQKAFKRDSRISYFCDDSISYVRNNSKKYDFVVADTPYGLNVYDGDTGLAVFQEDLIKVAYDDSIIVFNIHSNYMVKYNEIQKKINDMALKNNKNVSDIFFVSRNKLVAYGVIVLGKGIIKR